MANSYNLNVKLPKPSWFEGSLLIMKAFGGLPRDFEEWDIKLWKETVKISKEIIKISVERGPF